MSSLDDILELSAWSRVVCNRFQKISGDRIHFKLLCDQWLKFLIAHLYRTISRNNNSWAWLVKHFHELFFSLAICQINHKEFLSYLLQTWEENYDENHNYQVFLEKFVTVMTLSHQCNAIEYWRNGTHAKICQPFRRDKLAHKKTWKTVEEAYQV